MKWANSLIRITEHEVETLQKRLAAIVDQRMQAQMQQAALQAEGEIEISNVSAESGMAWQIGPYREGLKLRHAALQAEIDSLDAEEAGARDALAESFEALKKYETVAENHRLAKLAETGRREAAAMDELGLRMTRKP